MDNLSDLLLRMDASDLLAGLLAMSAIGGAAGGVLAVWAMAWMADRREPCAGARATDFNNHN